MARSRKRRLVLGSSVAAIVAAALATTGLTFGLFSSTETQTADALAGAVFSPSTAPVPTAANQTPGSNSVKITWGTVTLTDTSNSGTIKYTVVRSPGTVVCTLVSTTTCTDSAGTGGTNYTYTEEAFYVVNGVPTWSLGPSTASNQITFPETPSFTTTMTQPAMATVGNKWNDHATVTGDTNGGAPKGSVTFHICSTTSLANPCKTGGTTIATITSSTVTNYSSSGYSSSFKLPTSDARSPTVGIYCYYASYTATPAGGPYSSAALQTDNECFTVMAAAPSSFTTSVAGPGTTKVGNSWNDSATVTGNVTGGPPLGSVTFHICQTTALTNPCKTGGTTIATIATSTATNYVKTTSNHKSTVSLPAGDAKKPTAGVWCYWASYTAKAGGNYTSVAAQSDTECFTVTPATPTVTTTLSPPTPRTAGHSWSDTATVTGNTTGGAPTGTVTFKLCTELSPPTSCSTGTTIATVSTSTTTYFTKSGHVSTVTLPSTHQITTSGTYCFNVSYAPKTGSNYAGRSATSECFTVFAATGSGTMTVTPSNVVASSTHTYIFTYTASAGALTNGGVTVSYSAWTAAGGTAPTTNASTPGYTTASAGTLSVTTTSKLIKVTGLTLSKGGTFTITFGHTGELVTAPSTATSYTFTAQQRSASGGTLKSLATSPSVTVTAAGCSSSLHTATITLAKSGTTGTHVTFIVIGGGGGSGGASTKHPGGSGAAGAKLVGTFKNTNASASVTLKLKYAVACGGANGQTTAGGGLGGNGATGYTAAKGGSGGHGHSANGGGGGGGGGATALLWTRSGTLTLVALAGGGGAGAGGGQTATGGAGATQTGSKNSTTLKAGGTGANQTNSNKGGGGGGGGGVGTTATGGAANAGGSGGWNYTAKNTTTVGTVKITVKVTTTTPAHNAGQPGTVQL
jgi:hypothetical protein